MLRKLSTLVFCSFFAYAGSAASPSTDPVFSQIDKIVRTLSDITGLTEKHAVPYGRMTQPQLRRFLAHRIKTSLKPKELYADELTLKLFGMVPKNFDLKKSTLDLLTEQAAAFYDYQEKKLFMLDVSTFTSEETTLAHELSHALADQHFDLEKFMEGDQENDDENLAHTAVVEGQASWLMLAYNAKEQGGDWVPSAQMLSTVVDSMDTSTQQYPVLQGSPLYIQQSLIFPYGAGTSFFDAVYHKMGKKAFSEVFTNPPQSSAQILHPDRYFSHLKDSEPPLPHPQLTGEGNEISSGSVGEFDHQMLIWQASGKEAALALAPHVLGGQYRVTTAPKKNPVLIYSSQWDSTENAGKYFAVYQQLLKNKWKRCDATTRDEHLFAGSSDSGYFVTRWKGEYVTSVEGIQSLSDWQKLTQVEANE